MGARGPQLSGSGLQLTNAPCRFQAVITTYPPDLGVIDGRIFSPTSSGSESISPTPAFPVSPETLYGKKEAELVACNPTP